MNSNNRYLSETVDDDEFLRHSRSGSGYMLSNQYNQLGHNSHQQQQPQTPQSNSSLEQQRQVGGTSVRSNIIEEIGYVNSLIKEDKGVFKDLL